MMYSEFVKGTNCKETEFNYKVFKDLEEVYMNSNLTKEEIYAIGKMRVDNSETEAERKGREMVEAQLADYADQVEELEAQVAARLHNVEWYKDCVANDPDDSYSKGEIKFNKMMLADARKALKNLKAQIATYKAFMKV